jgi:hypothetical protein
MAGQSLLTFELCEAPKAGDTCPQKAQESAERCEDLDLMRLFPRWCPVEEFLFSCLRRRRRCCAPSRDATEDSACRQPTPTRIVVPEETT